MSSDVQAKCTNSRRERQPACWPSFSLDEVLDRLDVVVGLALDRLHGGGVASANSAAIAGRGGQVGCREPLHLGDARLGGERLQPRDLDADAVADRGLLR